MRRNPHRCDFYCFSLYFYCWTICCHFYCGYEEADILMKFIRTGICNLCKYYVTFSSSASHSLIKSHSSSPTFSTYTFLLLYFWSCRDDIYLIGNVSTRTRFSNVTNGLSLVEFTAIASFFLSHSLMVVMIKNCWYLYHSYHIEKNLFFKAVCFLHLPREWEYSVIFIDLNLNEINKEYFVALGTKGSWRRKIKSNLQARKIIILFSWK